MEASTASALPSLLTSAAMVCMAESVDTPPLVALAAYDASMAEASMASMLPSLLRSPSLMVTTDSLPAVVVVVTFGDAAAAVVVVTAAAPTLFAASAVKLLFTPIVTAAGTLSSADAVTTGIAPAQRANDSTDAISLLALIFFSFY